MSRPARGTRFPVWSCPNIANLLLLCLVNPISKNYKDLLVVPRSGHVVLWFLVLPPKLEGSSLQRMAVQIVTDLSNFVWKTKLSLFLWQLNYLLNMLRLASLLIEAQKLRIELRSSDASLWIAAQLVIFFCTNDLLYGRSKTILLYGTESTLVLFLQCSGWRMD
jgi:hypothetical protein